MNSLENPLEIALIHHPVYGKDGSIIKTSITTFDLHDIARTAKTYGVKRYWVVNPVPSQLWLARTIIEHWTSGVGAAYNPTRKEAIEIITLSSSLDEVCLTIESEVGIAPRLIGTSAKPHAKGLSYEQLKEEWRESKVPHVLLFGTGWGLAEEVLAQTNGRLIPLGEPEYNHLSVRAAVAIVLDRLCGR